MSVITEHGNTIECLTVPTKTVWVVFLLMPNPLCIHVSIDCCQIITCTLYSFVAALVTSAPEGRETEGGGEVNDLK